MVDSKENDKFDLGVKGLRTCISTQTTHIQYSVENEMMCMRLGFHRQLGHWLMYPFVIYWQTACSLSAIMIVLLTC